jgi:predicted transcriptional regulator
MPPIADYTELKTRVVGDLQRRVWAIMFEKGLSKRKVARDGNLPYTAVHDIVEHASDPKLTTLHRLAAGLGVDIAELIISEPCDP